MKLQSQVLRGTALELDQAVASTQSRHNAERIAILEGYLPKEQFQTDLNSLQMLFSFRRTQEKALLLLDKYTSALLHEDADQLPFACGVLEELVRLAFGVRFFINALEHGTPALFLSLGQHSAAALTAEEQTDTLLDLLKENQLTSVYYNIADLKRETTKLASLSATLLTLEFQPSYADTGLHLQVLVVSHCSNSSTLSFIFKSSAIVCRPLRPDSRSAAFSLSNDWSRLELPQFHSCASFSLKTPPRITK